MLLAGLPQKPRVLEGIGLHTTAVRTERRDDGAGQFDRATRCKLPKLAVFPSYGCLGPANDPGDVGGCGWSRVGVSE